MKHDSGHGNLNHPVRVRQISLIPDGSAVRRFSPDRRHGTYDITVSMSNPALRTSAVMTGPGISAGRRRPFVFLSLSYLCSPPRTDRVPIIPAECSAPCPPMYPFPCTVLFPSFGIMIHTLNQFIKNIQITQEFILLRIMQNIGVVW